MSPRPSLPGNRQATIALCLMLIAAAMAVAFTATAHAANYKMLLCAGNNGSNSFDTATNTASGTNPGGIFSFENYCGPAPDPAGNNAFLRIAENQSSGNAGVNAYGSISWTATPWVAIIAGGGYTREPGSFNDGWRGRFWAEDFGGGGHNILMQGSGVDNGSLGGIGWSTCSTFCSHLWPFGGYGDYRRFVFELTCMRPAGCDRSGWNAVDANTIVLILSDRQDAQVHFTNGSSLMTGGWVRGAQAVTWDSSDQGSGMRWERLWVDGAQRSVIDHGSECDLGYSGPNGEFARQFRPCSGGPYSRSYSLDTASVPDGARTIQICAQDYSQAAGLDGTGSQSCDQRTVHIDNTPPGKPAQLQVTSANPARYLDHFGAGFSLPPNQGSPIAKVHYDVVDSAGKVVVPERTVSATDPTSLTNIEGPPTPGDYSLRVWLEDSVGLVGPAASAPIPHDTTPPAAPQGLQVAAPDTPRSTDGFDLRWHNIVDDGAPIDAAHYQVLNGAGAVVVPTKTVGGDDPEAIESIEAPNEAGSGFTLRLWLSDAEGNVGAPVSAPLAYDCVRSPASGGAQLNATLGGGGTQTVAQGSGATLTGALQRADGTPVATAPVCVYSRTVTDRERDFLGIALTDAAGGYRFPIPAGPSRELSAVYRPGQRQLTAKATIQTTVKPTLRARKAVVRTGEVAHLEGEIPGPRNDDVVIVLQVKQGNGWLAFRRYRTRDGGHFEADYLFRRTSRPTTYEMRAQVRESTGYPYIEGDSDPLFLRVLPKRAASPKACPAGKNRVKRRGQVKCVGKRSRHTHARHVRLGRR